MSSEHPRSIAVGKITRVHGVRGEIAVLVLSEVEGRFEDGAVLFLENGRGLTVESSRRHGGRLLVKFREISGRSEAKRIAGGYLLVPESHLPELPAGSFWPHELEGCYVVTDEGRSLGVIREVVQNPANDIWVARTEDGTETLVPALRDVVLAVDIAAKRVVVREIQGLTVPEDA